jgi:hypothetical protein
MKQRGQNGSDCQHAAKRINFISGSKHQEAVWAMTLYERLGLGSRLHIRRLHYTDLLQDGLTLASGKAYRNTTADFEYLKNAFERAQLLGLIPYDVFSDSRGFALNGGLRGSNAQRRILLKQIVEQAYRRHIRNSLACFAPVHIEIWLERTSAADIVASLADKYNVKLVASEEDISLTSIWRFVRRISNISTPVRIFYFCDFDHNQSHPDAVEKVTAMLDQYGLSRTVDLKVLKLALSKDECDKYNLPAAPQDVMGIDNQTELHALEAAAPGLLCETLESHINRYTDYQSLKDAQKKVEASINRLLVKINHIIDDNTDVYQAFEGIQSMIQDN